MPTCRRRIDELEAHRAGRRDRACTRPCGAPAPPSSRSWATSTRRPTKALLEKQLGGWKSPKPYARIDPAVQGRGWPTSAVINTPDKQMALVAVGHPIEVRDDDPDYPALLLLNHVLGGSASSRLLQPAAPEGGAVLRRVLAHQRAPAGQARHLLRRGDLRPPERGQGDGRDAGGDRQAAADSVPGRGAGRRQEELRRQLGHQPGRGRLRRAASWPRGCTSIAPSITGGRSTTGSRR